MTLSGSPAPATTAAASPADDGRASREGWPEDARRDLVRGLQHLQGERLQTHPYRGARRLPVVVHQRAVVGCRVRGHQAHGHHLRDAGRRRGSELRIFPCGRTRRRIDEHHHHGHAAGRDPAGRRTGNDRRSGRRGGGLPVSASAASAASSWSPCSSASRSWAASSS